MKTGRDEFAKVEWWRRIPTIDNLKYKPIEWLIEDLIPLSNFVLMVGKPGSYKSWLALDIARAVARGEAFAQMASGPARDVLYMDRENGMNLVAARKQTLSIPETPKLRYWGRWVPLPFIGLASKELLAYAEQVQPLLIFDSLCRFHTANENDNSEMARVMDSFVALARKGATVLVLHHTGKDSEKNFRGAMEIEAAPDVAYRVDRKDRTVKLRQFKNRIAEERSFELVLGKFGFESLMRQEGVA